jgi:hypothetical protein
MRDDDDDLGQRTGVEVVTARAAIDADFRRALLADPHAAIYRAFGVQLPKALRMKFVERDPGVDLMIVLPDLVDDLSTLLDDDLLEGVAGGVEADLREGMLLMRARWS